MAMGRILIKHESKYPRAVCLKIILSVHFLLRQSPLEKHPSKATYYSLCGRRNDGGQGTVKQGTRGNVRIKY